MGELPPEEVVPPKEPAPKESILLWLADCAVANERLALRVSPPGGAI